MPRACGCRWLPWARGWPSERPCSLRRGPPPRRSWRPKATTCAPVWPLPCGVQPKVRGARRLRPRTQRAQRQVLGRGLWHRHCGGVCWPPRPLDHPARQQPRRHAWQGLRWKSIRRPPEARRPRARAPPRSAPRSPPPPRRPSPLPGRVLRPVRPVVRAPAPRRVRPRQHWSHARERSPAKGPRSTIGARGLAGTSWSRLAASWKQRCALNSQRLARGRPWLPSQRVTGPSPRWRPQQPARCCWQEGSPTGKPWPLLAEVRGEASTAVGPCS
mmetsp:Transcript_115681/g.322276  ORF Transcript_115681/g.322276 Transcript_115681/m.322276 type:complete len:272 (-) Transcript_115681:43-858(-)